jgi:hypothetical protein
MELFCLSCQYSGISQILQNYLATTSHALRIRLQCFLISQPGHRDMIVLQS